MMYLIIFLIMYQRKSMNGCVCLLRVIINRTSNHHEVLRGKTHGQNYHDKLMRIIVLILSHIGINKLQ